MSNETELEGKVESFDAKKIRGAISKMRPGAEQVVYSGLVARCDVDLFNSSDLVKLLKNRYGYSGSFYTQIIKRDVRRLVEERGGYWLGAKGDSAEFLFGDLDPGKIRDRLISCFAPLLLDVLEFRHGKLNH